MLVPQHQLSGPPLKSLLPSWRNQLRSCGLARLLSAMSFKLALSLTPCQGEDIDSIALRPTNQTAGLNVQTDRLRFAGHLSFIDGITKLRVATSVTHRQNRDTSEICIRILTEGL